MRTTRRALLACLLALTSGGAAQAAPPRCSTGECIVDLVDAGAQKQLEARRDRAELRIVILDPTPAAMASLARIPWITSLELRGYVSELEPVRKLTALRSLTLTGVRAKSLAPIAALRRLYSFSIALCDGTTDTDFRFLAEARELAVLKVSSCPGFTSAAPLGSLPKLDDVELVNTSIRSLDGLASSPINSLRVQGGATEVAALATMRRLSRLMLSDLPEATDFHALSGLPALERLDLLTTGIQALTALTSPKLIHASFAGSTALSDVSGLAGARSLRDVDLTGTAVVDLRPLSKLDELAVVYLQRSKVTDLAPLATARGLKTVIVGDDAPAAMRTSLSARHPGLHVLTETQARQAAQGSR